MKILSLFLCLSLGTAMAAAADKAKPLTTAQVKASMAQLSLAKGTQIEIYRYDAPSDTFEVSIVKEPGVGPNVATPEALYKAIDAGVDFTAFRKNHKDFLGAEYTLKEKLPLIEVAEIAKRKKSLGH